MNQLSTPMSIVIPAHDEVEGIGALLRRLEPLAHRADVVVVCNGCTDGTADAARAAAPWAQVVEIDRGSKVLALQLGDSVVTGFPRLYLDADSTIDARSIETMAHELTQRDLRAIAPTPTYTYRDVSAVVKSHHRLWALTRTGISSIAGTGAMMISHHGRSRFDGWPDVIGDDSFLDGLFDDGEKQRLADVRVLVDIPNRFGPYVRRRARVAQGNHDVVAAGHRPATPGTAIGVLDAVIAHPRHIVHLPGFALITVAGRLLAVWRRRRGVHRHFVRERGSVSPESVV